MASFRDCSPLTLGYKENRTPVESFTGNDSECTPLVRNARISQGSIMVVDVYLTGLIGMYCLKQSYQRASRRVTKHGFIINHQSVHESKKMKLTIDRFLQTPAFGFGRRISE
jgi:hypothetical protein